MSGQAKRQEGGREPPGRRLEKENCEVAQQLTEQATILNNIDGILQKLVREVAVGNELSKKKILKKDSEIQNLKQDLEIVRDSKASVEVELQQSKETLENTEKKKNHLEEEHERAKQELQKQTNEKKQGADRNRQLEAHVEALKGQLQDFKTNLEEETTTLNRYKRQFTRAELEGREDASFTFIVLNRGCPGHLAHHLATKIKDLYPYCKHQVRSWQEIGSDKSLLTNEELSGVVFMFGPSGRTVSQTKNDLDDDFQSLLGDLKVAKVFLPVITMNKKAKVPVVSGVTMLRDSFFTYNSSGQKEDINQSFDISPKELRHLIRILMGVPNP
ncbi:uncharacterized protein LOC134178349 [Corticium candelabrum]|uniref:uncharacterized protein LOC134178349 n=1 Tax=Corticium candelabrum TaxID=121492 RepID=UPI002E2631C3|nr:uncharacterized protein LOC134178349 [Corticium candelabrum]